MKPHIRFHPLRDVKLSGWNEQIRGRWSYRQLRSDADWAHGWISFDAVTWDNEQQVVWCGLNSIDGDLLYAFEPKTEKFHSMGTQAWADPYDVKIHRTILKSSRDGNIYFGTSLLHDLDEQHLAKGGKLVRFNPTSKKYTVLSVPAPSLYIQSIAYDEARSILYAFTYPAEGLVRHDLKTGTNRFLAWIGSPAHFAQPHTAVVDRFGWLWGTYAETRAWDETVGASPIRLFKYHPDTDQFVWFEHGLSRVSDSEQLIDKPPLSAGKSLLDQTRHHTDYGYCDSMVYDGSEYIYAGTVAGVLCRIAIQTGSVEKIAHLITTGRLPALALRDRILYAGGGLNGRTQVARWNTRTGELDMCHSLIAKHGDKPERIHELTVSPDHTVFLGENDNHQRSSYLWSLIWP